MISRLRRGAKLCWQLLAMLIFLGTMQVAPPGDFRDWTRDDWIKALDANMLTAIELIKAVIDPMIEQRFGRIVNITSGSVKSPIPQLGCLMARAQD